MVTVRRLHSSIAVVDVGEVDEGVEDEVSEPLEVEVAVVSEELVVAPGVVVVVGLLPVDDVAADAEVDDPSAVLDVVVSEGATAAGASPTWESARPTICHASTVATARAATQAAAKRQEIIGVILSGLVAISDQRPLKVPSRLVPETVS